MTEKYIGANAFIGVLKEMQKDFCECPRAFGKTAAGVLEKVINKLQSFPTADVAPVVHAHWVTGQDNEKVFCSACSIPISGEPDKIKKYFKICFNCGAKMDEEVEDK